jgi:hypothetical protein
MTVEEYIPLPREIRNKAGNSPNPNAAQRAFEVVRNNPGKSVGVSASQPEKTEQTVKSTASSATNQTPELATWVSSLSSMEVLLQIVLVALFVGVAVDEIR